MARKSGTASDATPSPSQRRAIEAEPGALLVLAGPGAGKTYCLTERIGWLIAKHKYDPARICAFTFTNKAAGEIAHRLEARLRAQSAAITGGTIHAFCAALLRTHATEAGLAPGFGIADEEYQLSVLRRLEGPRRWHRSTLNRFSQWRLRGDGIPTEDMRLYEQYASFLADRNVLDFDSLVLRARDLLERAPAAAAVARARFDVVLVDEFQDLNPAQYAVIRSLALDHRHVFAVGDDEQSIYSWAGADLKVFEAFRAEFKPATEHLEENRRCPRDVFALARKLVTANTPLFPDRVAANAERASAFPIRALTFLTEHSEAAWLVEDLRRDREAHGHRWGSVAILYRRHDIGEPIETALLNAGIPCRLAQGRALTDDPVVAYVFAALRVIATPHDDILETDFFRAVLPRPIFDEARAKAEEGRVALRRELSLMLTRLTRGDETSRQIRRALANLRNLEAIAKQQTSLAALVQELLARRVGRVQSDLVEHEDAISDPASHDDVRALAARLREAREKRAFVFVPPLGGAEVAIQGMLVALGIKAVRGTLAPKDSLRLGAGETPSLGLALGVFKAAQLLEMEGAASGFRNYTAIDIETTGRNRQTDQVVELAAARVRDGKVVATFSELVKPAIPMAPEASKVTGISDTDLAGKPPLAEVWPAFRAFVGTDVTVAHNGYHFDFPILRREAEAHGVTFESSTFDTLPLAAELIPTSRKLVDLATHFGVEVKESHRALADAEVLVGVLGHLEAKKLSRARKTALLDLLGHLGIALALTPDDALGEEARLLRRLSRVFALGRYSGALEWYSAERADDTSIPAVDEVITALGGEELMQRIRAEKTADERYPAAMARLRRIIAGIPDGTLAEELSTFLERTALSKHEGVDVERDAVNLMTLHSTKGLEFSRVYVVGVEDSQLPGGSPTKGTKASEVEEARRLLYVGMTRTIDRLVLTHVTERGGKPTGGHRFLDEMDIEAEEAE